MIKNFLIISCTGKNDSIGLRIDNKYFINKLQTNFFKNEILTQTILDLIEKHKVKIDANLSILINTGPGSFSGLRISLSVAKGMALAKNLNIFGYNHFLLNLADQLKEKKKIISIQKTKKFYYFLKVDFTNSYTISKPQKVDFSKIIKEDIITVAPMEMKNDQVFKENNINKLKYVEFNLRNIDILIKNNLLENKLIKPLYLS
jgi:tRNA A37 threonylcarbamoyladenosine modification protein TsaB